MSQKAIVVQGAICKCQFGQLPDKIKVLSHTKEYANDKEGSQKLIVTTKEVGAATLEANTFGSCPKLGLFSPPCKPIITEWKEYYEAVQLSNGGYVILEDSKAVCAVAGTPCIEIIHHGQMAEPCQQNFENADDNVQVQLNPMVNPEMMYKEQPSHEGLEYGVI